MSSSMKKLFILIIPLLAVFLLTPTAFAKKHKKHCRDRYYDSYSGRPYYDRPYYDRGRYSRYDDRYYDNDYSRRRAPRYDGYYGDGYSYPSGGYYGGGYYPPAPIGNIPWWDILIPRY